MAVAAKVEEAATSSSLTDDNLLLAGWLCHQEVRRIREVATWEIG